MAFDILNAVGGVILFKGRFWAFFDGLNIVKLFDSLCQYVAFIFNV